MLQAWRHGIRDVKVTGSDSLNVLCRNETKNVAAGMYAAATDDKPSSGRILTVTVTPVDSCSISSFAVLSPAVAGKTVR